MKSPLQEKDDHWRDRRANGATPVFDPGMAPPGSDAEAGGAPAAAPEVHTPGPARPPLPTSPDRNGHGLRLTPRVWFAAAGAVALLLAIAGWLSLP